MGTREYLLDKVKQEGEIAGKLEDKIEMFKELGFTIAQVCEKLKLTKPEVERYFKEAQDQKLWFYKDTWSSQIWSGFFVSDVFWLFFFSKA